MAQKAISLDPLSPTVRTTAALAYYLNGEIDTAVVEFERILEMDRSDPSSNYYLAWALEQNGDFDEAIALHERAIELSEAAPLYVGGLGYSYGLAGRNAEAQLILEELIAREAEGLAEPYNVAIVHIGLGNTEQAMDWLEKAFEAHNSHMVYIKQGPQFDPLRDEPRFKTLIRRMGW